MKLRSLILAGLAAASVAGLAVSFASAAGSIAPETAKNLDAAMHGEAYASLKYLQFAALAREEGQPEIAKLFEEASNVEAAEHFDREANAIGLKTTLKAALEDAAGGETYENTRMYVEFADQADAAGDAKVAELFRQIAADEGDHAAAYKQALAKLTAQSN